MSERQILFDDTDSNFGKPSTVFAIVPITDSSQLNMPTWGGLGRAQYALYQSELAKGSTFRAYVEDVNRCTVIRGGGEVCSIVTQKTIVQNYPGAPWRDVPLPRTPADILTYNRTVLTLMVLSTINMRWGIVTSTWWESLIAKFELSSETQLVVQQNVEEQTLRSVENLERENPLLFGFEKSDIANYFGFSSRTALALIRLALKTSTMSDYIYLEPIKPRGAEISTGLLYLAQHPKGSHYSGDFNFENMMGTMDPAIVFGMAVSAILTMGASTWSFGPVAAASSVVTQNQMLIMAGAFGAGLTASSLIQDIVDGDFGLTSIAKLGGLFLYGWGVLVNFSMLNISAGMARNIQTGVGAGVAGATTGQALASGDPSILGQLSSVLGMIPAVATMFAQSTWSMLTNIQRTLFASVGKLLGYVGEGVGFVAGALTPNTPRLPQPSTVQNPGGGGIPAYAYVNQMYDQPIPIADMDDGADIGSLIAPVAAIGGLYLIMKG